MAVDRAETHDFGIGIRLRRMLAGAALAGFAALVCLSGPVPAAAETPRAITGTKTPLPQKSPPTTATIDKLQPGPQSGRIPPSRDVAGVTPSLNQAEVPPGSSDSQRVAIATGSEFSVDGAVTRFTLALSAAVPIEAFVLADPYRVVVEMPETRFDVTGVSRDGKGLVKSWRYGLFATGRSRLVFETAGPTRVVSARVTPAGTGPSTVLTLEMVPTTRDAVLAAARPRPQAAVAMPEPLSPERVLTKSDRQPVTVPARRKSVIVLDPGHGGIDAGTVSPHSATPEKQVVLEFSKLLKAKLEATGRYDVMLTRSTDTFVPLGDRIKFARAQHADLMVSIHADAELDRSVRGSTIFTLSDKASDAQAAALAAKENQSDALAGIVTDDRPDEVADILIDLTMRETRQFSHVLARNLVAALAKTGHMVKQQPHRSASLKVLKAHDFPSVLIELGFLSNREDEAELMSKDWRDRTCTSIIGSIDQFFAAREASVVP